MAVTAAAKFLTEKYEPQVANIQIFYSSISIFDLYDLEVLNEIYT